MGNRETVGNNPNPQRPENPNPTPQSNNNPNNPNNPTRPSSTLPAGPSDDFEQGSLFSGLELVGNEPDPPGIPETQTGVPIRKSPQEEAAELKREKDEKARLERDLEEKVKLENLKREQERKDQLETAERIKRERDILIEERKNKEREDREKRERDKERDLLEKDRKEKERIDRERKEKELRLERDKKEKERIEKEKIEQDRLDKERLERERIERERIEFEKNELERKEREAREREEFLKRENIEERLKKMEDVIQNWSDKQQAIEKDQEELLLKKLEYHNNLIEILKSQKSTEATQSELIAAENYREAENLSQQLDLYKEESKKISQNILESSRQWINLEGDRCAVIEKLSQIRKEGIENLKLLEEQQTKTVEETKRLLREEIQLMDTTVGKTTQRIERELQHIKVDLESLVEKDQRIETIIKEKTSSQRTERQDLIKRKGSIVAEIKELLAQIDTIRSEENEYSNVLVNLDKEIANARSRYNLDLQKIQQEKEQMIKNKKRLEVEQTETNREFELANAKLKQIQNVCQQDESLLSSIENSAELSRQLIKVYDRQQLESNEIKSAEEKLLEDDIQENSELKSLKHSLSLVEDHIKELTTTILLSKNEIRVLEQLINTAQNTTLLNMESEKKLAVKRRDFKGAQTVQANMAELQDQILQQSMKKQELEQKLISANSALEKEEIEQKRLEIIVNEKSRESDIERLKKIIQRIVQLRIIQKRIEQHQNQPPQQPQSPSGQSQTQLQHIQRKLEIERAKVSYIRVIHDLPEEEEPELPSIEEPPPKKEPEHERSPSPPVPKKSNIAVPPSSPSRDHKLTSKTNPTTTNTPQKSINSPKISHTDTQKVNQENILVESRHSINDRPISDPKSYATEISIQTTVQHSEPPSSPDIPQTDITDIPPQQSISSEHQVLDDNTDNTNNDIQTEEQPLENPSENPNETTEENTIHDNDLPTNLDNEISENLNNQLESINPIEDNNQINDNQNDNQTNDNNNQTDNQINDDNIQTDDNQTNDNNNIQTDENQEEQLEEESVKELTEPVDIEFGGSSFDFISMTD